MPNDARKISKRLRFVVVNLQGQDGDLVQSITYFSPNQSKMISADVTRSELRTIVERFKENRVVLDEIIFRWKQSMDMGSSDDDARPMWTSGSAKAVQELCDPDDAERASVVLAALNSEIVLQLVWSELGPEYLSENGTHVSIRC